MRTVSIIVPCCNAEPYLAETVESVLAQTFDDWELLLVNDGSRDGTLAIMERYAALHDRIRVWDMGDNCGISPSRNFGTRLTHGRHIMHLDGDDILTPTALQEHLDALLDADVSYAGYTHFEKSPQEPLRTFIGDLPPGRELLAILAAGIEAGSWWLPPGALMVRREADTRARERFSVWTRHVPVAGEMHYYACLYHSGARFSPTGKVGVHSRKHPLSDSASATTYALSLGHLWLLDFWIKELGPDPELLRRKADLFQALEIATRVEREFLVQHL